MTKNTTKRALFASVISLLLCVSMLVGTTFAWFTDTATTGVNQIQSGKLKVDLVDKDGNSLEGKTLDFVKAPGAEDEEILWEPGCTYNLPEIFVKNNGNLALKYQIVITGINGDAKLNEAIEWTIQLDGADLATSYSLGAGETSKALTISGHMKEEAGNEYQGLTIDGISITVVATQDTVENDSFNNLYDENADYMAAVVTKIPAAQLTVNAATDFGNMNNTAPLTLDAGYTFLAADTAEKANASVYKNWHADFVVSTDTAIPAGALTLAGQYDTWSPNWLSFQNPNAVAADEEIRLLETAGVTVNYAELCSLVKEFNCGVAGHYLEDTTITVELRLYEATGAAVSTETGEYMTIGSYSYTFGKDLPTASVNELINDELTVDAATDFGNMSNTAPLVLDAGYTFTAVDTADEAAASPYAQWNADFVVTVDQAVAAGALTLAGQYDSWSANWLSFQNPNALAANEATRLLGTAGVTMNYAELCNYVQKFNCGVAGKASLSGATITVELRLFETVNGTETGNYEVIGSYSYTFEEKTLPTASVVELVDDALTVNAATDFGNMSNTAPLVLDTGYTFTAVDSAEAAAASPYAKWNADFVVTVDQAVAAGALTLAGQYDSWSANWLSFQNPDALAANVPTRLLATANVKMSYAELCSLVKEFNCGAAAGEALDGATITVELRLFETVNGTETGNYETIGSYSYTFDEKALPTASVTELTGNALTVNATVGTGSTVSEITLDTGYTFTAVDSAEAAAASPYAKWNADFVVTVDQAVAAGALTLAGQYDGWSENWVSFQNPEALEANKATRLLASVGGSMTYEELCSLVKEFNCGAAAGEDLAGAIITVELRLFETVDGGETGNYEVIGSYSYTF